MTLARWECNSGARRDFFGIKLKLPNPQELAKLIDATAYQAYIAEKQKEATV